MALACQRDCYLKNLHTTVVSCEEASLTVIENGKVVTLPGFNVILEDSVLFPEGGGQPDDRGTIAGKGVLRVIRCGIQAVHFVKSSFQPNEEVDVEVEWDRRFDHMQQHSGQHLITAIADLQYGMNTTSWNLGEHVSSIELDTTFISNEVFTKLEEEVNAKIRACVPVITKSYDAGASELKEVRTRGLPDDYKGPVRIITIQGIDSNMCCGTHVANLAHLQMIKLLSVEKGKKNKTNLFFVAGNRVLRYMQQTVEREKAFTSILKGGPDHHVDLLDKMQKSLKLAQKNELNLLRDLALLEAHKIQTLEPKPLFYTLHRKEGNADFMSIIVKEVNDENVLLFLSVGEEKSSGQIIISGKAEIVADVGPKVAEILEGKGATKGNRFQGKVSNMSQRSKAEQILKEAVYSVKYGPTKEIQLVKNKE